MPYIIAKFEFKFYKTIQFIEIQISEKLAGQIPDRQSLASYFIDGIGGINHLIHRISVPVHANKPLKIGLLNSILKISGIDLN